MYKRQVSKLPALFERLRIGDMEVVQIAVSRLNAKNLFQTEPAPWIVSGKAR